MNRLLLLPLAALLLAAPACSKKTDPAPAQTPPAAAGDVLVGGAWRSHRYTEQVVAADGALGPENAVNVVANSLTFAADGSYQHTQHTNFNPPPTAGTYTRQGQTLRMVNHQGRVFVYTVTTLTATRLVYTWDVTVQPAPGQSERRRYTSTYVR